MAQQATALHAHAQDLGEQNIVLRQRCSSGLYCLFALGTMHAIVDILICLLTPSLNLTADEPVDTRALRDQRAAELASLQEASALLASPGLPCITRAALSFFFFR